MGILGDLWRAARSSEGLQITVAVGQPIEVEHPPSENLTGPQPGVADTDCLVCGKRSNSSAADSKLCARCGSEALSWIRGYRKTVPTRLLSDDWSSSIIHHLSPDVLRCYLCGQATDDDGHKRNIEHVIPLHEGGSPYLPNIGIAGASCNFSKGGRIIDLTTEQAERWGRQQEAFARRYAVMRPYSEIAFDGSLALTLYGTFGYNVFGLPMEILPERIFYEAIVTQASRFIWKDGQRPPEDPLADDFLELCISAATRAVKVYRERGWLPSDFDDTEIPARIAETSVRVRTPLQARWKEKRRW